MLAQAPGGAIIWGASMLWILMHQAGLQGSCQTAAMQQAWCLAAPQHNAHLVAAAALSLADTRKH